MAELDWVAWHEEYEAPDSALGRRLRHVRSLVAEALDELGGSARRIVSLCAGDGRDVLPVLAERPTPRPSVLLVELETRLAERAAERAARLALDDVVVAVADAGDTAVFAGDLPADLLLLCGIFGNIAEADIERTVAAAAGMVADGGFAIWTRGPMEPELRPQIRDWFREAGFEIVAYEGPPTPYGVGMGRRADSGAAGGTPLPDRLFTFMR